MHELLQRQRSRAEGRRPQTSAALRRSPLKGGSEGADSVWIATAHVVTETAVHLGGAVQTAAPSSLSRSVMTVHRLESTHPLAGSDTAPEEQSQGAWGSRPSVGTLHTISKPRSRYIARNICGGLSADRAGFVSLQLVALAYVESIDSLFDDRDSAIGMSRAFQLQINLQASKARRVKCSLSLKCMQTCRLVGYCPCSLLVMCPVCLEGGRSRGASHDVDLQCWLRQLQRQ